MKLCTTCKVEKPLTEFHKNKSKPDGHALQCKSCKKVAVAKSGFNKKFNGPKIPAVCNVKQCTKCKVVRSVEDFRVSNRSDSGFASSCKLCDKDYREVTFEHRQRKNKEWQENNKEYLIEYRANYYKDNREALLQYQIQYREDNKEELIEYRSSFYSENRDRLLCDRRYYYQKNKDKVAERNRDYHKRNPHIKLTSSARRRATKLNATPAWLTEEHNFMLSCIYEYRKEITEATGVERHVDHIVPLINDRVCGLHVPWNLQVITAKENLSKSNKF
jgi:hypothetical protein